MEKKHRILLVDDDADFIDANKAALESQGFEVLAAYSGREGLDKVRFEQPDLIVLDLIMEKHDAGFAFARAVKADPLSKHIPILMLSSSAADTGYEFSQELDGYWMKTDDYASKPLPPEELLARVQELLVKSRRRA
jgi:two-component system alkaline phosphatase synthesis response regulator PhoP